MTGPAQCAGATAEVDPWIPLKIIWSPRPSGLQVHLSIAGLDGGFVELKVDEATGRLFQLTVVEAPPVVENASWLSSTSNEDQGSATLGREYWAEVQASTASRLKIVERRERLRFQRVKDRAILIFGTADPVIAYSCGSASIGIAEDSSLAAVAAVVTEVDPVAKIKVT